jgi:hypothetical protein
MPWEPSDQELKKAAPHIARELTSLRQAWHRHSADPFAWTAWFVHCRNLVDFFEGNGKDKDLFARHYADAAAWSGAMSRLEAPERFSEYKDAAAKLAAHLTYHRVELAEQNYVPSQAVTAHLLGLGMLFLQMLPPPRSAWFGDLAL